MKHFPIIALGALAIMSSCNSRPANQFDLRGSIDGADGQTIYLSYAIGDSSVVDSTVIADGAFVFTGTIDGPTNSILYTGKPLWESKTVTSIYLEPTEIAISGLNAEDYSSASVTGSKTQSEVDEYSAITKPISARLMEIRQVMPTADEATRPALEAESDSLSDAYASATLDFIKNHPDSYYSASLLSYQAGHTSYEDLKSLYDGLSPEVQAQAKDVAKELSALESVMPGKPAPDLIGTNPDGKEIKLSDLKGKVVLVDFWATWCGPCMAMAPIVEQLAAEYEGKAIVGKYNLDDENDFATECGIRSLPTLLFFKNGEKTALRLVGGQKAEAIRAKIEELLAL